MLEREGPPRRVWIVGAGGYGKVIADLLRALGHAPSARSTSRRRRSGACLTGFGKAVGLTSASGSGLALFFFFVLAFAIRKRHLGAF